ncbi:hypothetical protein [Caballeronia terrestris]
MLLAAIADVAKARGMAKVTAAAGWKGKACTRRWRRAMRP